MPIRTASLLRVVLVSVALALPLAGCSSGATGTTGTPSATATAAPSVTMTTATPSASPSSAATSASASPTPTSTAKTYTMAEVKQHAKASSCWSAIDGNVYDLTTWVDRHPGGRARILRLCGKDGTGEFHGEHGKEAEPNKMLKGFKIGALS